MRDGAAARLFAALRGEAGSTQPAAAAGVDFRRSLEHGVKRGLWTRQWAVDTYGVGGELVDWQPVDPLGETYNTSLWSAVLREWDGGPSRERGDRILVRALDAPLPAAFTTR